MATAIVKTGGSVSQILKDMGVSSYASKSSWDAVAAANKLDSRYTVYNGQKLIIPDSLLGGSSSSAAPASVTPTPITPTVTATPQTPSELTNYLNEQQAQMNQLENFDPFAGKSSGEAVSDFVTGDALGMQGEAPVAPKYEDTFNKLRNDMGLGTIESSINEYKNMIREQENLLMQQKNTERSKTVGMGVIEGRVDQATRDRQEQISWLSSNVSYLTDVANSAYNYINMTMNFKQMDYETAKNEYDSEFNKRLGIYDMLKTDAKEERDFQMQLRQEQQRVASAQLSMYADLVSKGQMVWNSLSVDEQLQVHKLEVQAGYPVGFLSKIIIPKGSTIQSITNHTDPSGNIIADIIYVDPVTGNVDIQHKTIGKTKVSSGSSGGTAAERTAAASSAFIKNAGKKGTSEYKLTMSAMSKYGTPIGNTGAFRITTEDQAYNAAEYLANVANISVESATISVQQLMKSLGM